MSILSFKKRNNKSLNEMINYITDPDKTQTDLIYGIGVNASYALEEMTFAHLIYNSNNINFTHIIFSFDNDVSIPIYAIKQICYEIGMLWGIKYQVLLAIHLNTNNIHAHYLVNNIEVYTGKKFKQTISVVGYKKIINTILAKYSLNLIYYYGMYTFKCA